MNNRKRPFGDKITNQNFRRKIDVSNTMKNDYVAFDDNLMEDFKREQMIQNVNNKNNTNKTVENKTNININIQGNATRNDARAIAREMNKAIENNNYRHNMLNDKR